MISFEIGVSKRMVIAATFTNKGYKVTPSPAFDLWIEKFESVGKTVMNLNESTNNGENNLIWRSGRF